MKKTLVHTGHSSRAGTSRMLGSKTTGVPMAIGKMRSCFARSPRRVLAEIRYSGVRQICLIGGGDLLFDSARSLIDADFKVCALLAPRHADETLPLIGGILRQKLEAVGLPVHVTEDVNNLSSWPL